MQISAFELKATKMFFELPVENVEELIICTYAVDELAKPRIAMTKNRKAGSKNTRDKTGKELPK